MTEAGNGAFPAGGEVEEQEPAAAPGRYAGSGPLIDVLTGSVRQRE